jgi:prepilin-type N-terminal cleavage/methylation domain-containing protein/prepilin-type processing-associated H-X9-DG protein
MKQSGFTIIELLVVITIIVLLAAVLIPVLNRARSEAKKVCCAANVKQLIVALTIYEDQNRKFPYGFDSNNIQIKATPPGGWRNTSFDMQGWWWFQFLASVIGKDIDRNSNLWCPARSIKDTGIKKNILCGDYGVNQSVCKDSVGNKGSEFIGAPLKTDQIRYPARTFLVMDSGYSTIMWWYATTTPPRKINSGIMDDSAYVPGLNQVNEYRVENHLFRTGVDQDATNGRHPNKHLNCGFVDGHMESMTAIDFLVNECGTGYTSSPLWTPR